HFHCRRGHRRRAGSHDVDEQPDHARRNLRSDALFRGAVAGRHKPCAHEYGTYARQDTAREAGSGGDMIQHWTLNRYLGRQYVLWFFAFMMGLAGVIFLFEVAELLRRAGDRSDTTLGLIIRMGIYKMPDTIEHILPFVVLFAGMFTFWRLTRS